MEIMGGGGGRIFYIAKASVKQKELFTLKLSCTWLPRYAYNVPSWGFGKKVGLNWK